MFSQAAKSVVRSFGSRRIRIDEKNFKIALIGAEEISQNLSGSLKNNTKRNALALHDVAIVRPLPNYEQSFKPIPSEITPAKKSCSGEASRSNAAISARRTDNNNEENNGMSQIEKLVEALYRLPIAEEAPALNSPLIPIEELTPKAGNACGRMRPYARVLGERDSSVVKTWQRGFVTVAIRRCSSDSMYPPFREHHSIPAVKISKRHRSIEKTRKTIGRSSRAAEENTRQLSPPTSLLCREAEKPAESLTKAFRNVGFVLRGIEARWRAVEKLAEWITPEVLSNNKLALSRKIHSRIKSPSSSLDLVGRKRESNPLGRGRETMTGGTLNAVEQENWIRRTRGKLESVLPNLHAKIRLRIPTTAGPGPYCPENIFAVSQALPFSNVISNGAVLLASSKDSEDDRRKIGIRKKIQDFCMQRRKPVKKNKNDNCNQKEKKAEDACEKRERIDCPESRTSANERPNVVSCERRKTNCGERKSIRECREIRERKVQEDPCKPKKIDISREEDPCRPAKPEKTYELHDTDPCRLDKKEEVEIKLHDQDPCRLDKKEDAEVKLHDTDPCRLDKKEEIKKVDPCEKKPCPTVKKAPKCEDDTKGRSC